MTSSGIDLDLVAAEWPAAARRGTYLNSGSCGVKPKSVLKAIEEGWNSLNENPTIATFLDMEIWESARSAAATLFNCNDPSGLILTQNSTSGIQLVMQSLLLQAGDEFVTTDMEHSCVRTLCTYLEQQRGIVVKRHSINSNDGSEKFCQGVLDLVGPKTKLVLVSEVNCLSGWRPQLRPLADELNSRRVALLVDGAHSPGQGPINISGYPFWVGSGHKWMGAPNGTGFLYVRSDWREALRPVAIGDRLFNPEYSFAHRFEWPGTCDVVRFKGLEAAINLQLRLGPEKIAARQKELHKYLCDSIAAKLPILPPYKTRIPFPDGESTALYSISWPKVSLRTGDLRESLWQQNQIWIQPDYSNQHPGTGMRVSCHIFNTEADIDRLIAALQLQIFPQGFCAG